MKALVEIPHRNIFTMKELYCVSSDYNQQFKLNLTYYHIITTKFNAAITYWIHIIIIACH